LHKEIGWSLFHHGAVSINLNGGSVAGVSVGARANEEGASLGLWVFVDPKKAAGARVIKQAAGLDSPWIRDAGWEPLGVYRPLDSFKGEQRREPVAS
jgi:hypothetical protein